MKGLNRLILLTIAFDLFIVIGAGHGIGILGLVELFGFTEFFDNTVKISLTGSYDNRLYTSALFSLIGQVVLLIAYFVKTQISKMKLVCAGQIILLFSFFILTNNFLKSNADSLSFWTGIPYLITVLIFFVWIILNKCDNTV